MSGGHFDYKQYSLEHMAEEIQTIIENNDSTEKNQYGDRIGSGFTPQTIQEMHKAAAFLRIAYIFAQRVDWLVSGDDGEDTFHRRLHKDLSDLCAINPSAHAIMSAASQTESTNSVVIEALAHSLIGSKKPS